jgi:transposase InsO family protein
MSTLKRYFTNPTVKNLVFQKRNRGDVDALTGFFPFLDRLRCSQRNMQWQLDADRIPFHCNEGGTAIKPVYYLVVDNHSGDAIGYSLSLSENGASAVDAIRMAVYNTGCLPYELLTDNAPCYLSDEFKSLITLAEFYGCRYRTARIKNPNDKSVVEQTFRSIHAIFRTISGYIGHRVKARRRDSFPNEEQKKLAAKPEYIRDYCGIAAMLPDAIIRFRNHSFSGKPCIKQVYDSSLSPKDGILELWKIGKLFWVTEQMKVRGNRIKFKYKGLEYKFRILDTRLGLKVNGTVVSGRFSPFDPSRLLIYHRMTDVFIAELNGHDAIYTLEEDMTEYDKKEFAEYNNKLKTMKTEHSELLDKKKKEAIEVLKRTGFKKKEKHYEVDSSTIESLNGVL